MKFKKYWLLLCMAVCMGIVFSGCGDQSEKTEDTQETEATTDKSEEPTTEEVTEFSKDQKTISFSDIENGINFKAAGSSVTFSFEDIDSFDNTLKMEFSLTDAAYEKEPVTMKISEKQADYTFSDLEKGKEYYLEVYPTESASSDSAYKKIEKNNSSCQLQLNQ